MKRAYTLCFSLFLSPFLFGQSAPNFFQHINHSQVFLPENAETVEAPADYLLLSLDFNGMVNNLRSAPPQGEGEGLEVQIPMADGTWETFRVWESTPMEPELAERYPMIKGFTGVGVTKGHHIVKLGYGPAGFMAFVPSENGGSFVSRMAFGQTQYYYCHTHDNSYYENLGLTDTFLKKVAWENEASDKTEMVEDTPVSFRGGGDGAMVERRSYRFVLACTGEYGSTHGGTVEAALGTLMEATMILNSVLERDANVRLVLNAQNDQVVFVDPDSDPYQVSNNGNALMTENQNVLNDYIGNSFFDVGHLFTNGCEDVGGVVGGGICSDGKSRGVTCHSINNVAAITISIAAHEMGHQLNVGHTFNRCGNNTGAYQSGSAREPGSGSTIVSYQNACGSDNIPGSANLHYHNGSIFEFWSFLNGAANSCPVKHTTSNHHPVVSLDYPEEFFIPISTPFELEGVATDEDGDALTYAWEQMNLGPSVPLGSPAGNSPIFRVFDPSTSPKRVFPRLNKILNNQSDITEILPTYSRDLDFRLLVRDNNVSENAGGITWQDVHFEATETAGPFLVTYPNTSDVQWKGGEQVEVTWDVANTDNALVNCQGVNIKLSTDGGQSFPHLLAASTPNDGSEFITVPDLSSNNVRIRIEAAQNIFFDLSNQNFQVVPADAPTYSIIPDPEYQQVCLPENASVEISIGAILGYDEPVQLEIIEGLPSGIEAEFSANPVLPGETTILTFDLSSLLDDSEFDIQLQATSAVGTIIKTLSLHNVYNDFTALELEAPTDGQSNLSLLGTFEWTDLPQADLFDFQLATSPTFDETTIIEEAYGLTSANFDSEVPLEPSTIYYWRVRPSNARCGYSPYTSASVFQTFYTTCDQFQSEDGPINISGSGLPVINSQIPVLQSGTISDVNVSKIKGQHDALPDLKVTLRSPSGTEVILFEGICGNTSLFNFGMDDESPFPIDCPPLDGLRYIPQNPLSAFDGEDILGNWGLEVAVISTQGDGGELDKWGIEFCAAVNAQHPFLVENDTIFVQPLEERIIHNFELYADDPDNIGDDLIFTIVDETDFGFISKNGTPLGPSDKFKLTDINNQSITYTNMDGAADYDFFSFHITDGNGGLLATPRFHIVIDDNALTSTIEKSFSDGVMLYPNPTASRLTVAFPQPLASSATLLVSDVQGRAISQREMPQSDRQFELDLENLADGIYFLTVRSEEGIFTKKFVVQK